MKTTPRVLVVLSASILALSLSSANAAQVPTFIPGTYALSTSAFGGNDSTVVVADGVGGQVDFAVTTPTVSATFALPGGEPIDGLALAGSPYFESRFISPSFDATTYPFVTFYTVAEDGGLNIGDASGGFGNNLFDLYTDAAGDPSQLYTLSGGVPEPDAWLFLITGFAGLGLLVRHRSPFAGARAR